jgi:hypothetical protein
MRGVPMKEQYADAPASDIPAVLGSGSSSAPPPLPPARCRMAVRLSRAFQFCHLCPGREVTVNIGHHSYNDLALTLTQACENLEPNLPKPYRARDGKVSTY